MAEGIEVRNLREFRDQLRLVAVEYPKVLAAVNRDVAKEGAELARSMAGSGTRAQAAAAKAIVGKATQTEASIGLGSTKRIPFSSVTFWGATRRTGWYAAGRYRNSTRQHPPWVGNTWEVGVAGQGPYVINDALARYLPQLLARHGEALEALARQAFND